MSANTNSYQHSKLGYYSNGSQSIPPLPGMNSEQLDFEAKEHYLKGERTPDSSSIYKAVGKNQLMSLGAKGDSSPKGNGVLPPSGERHSLQSTI